MPEMFHKLTSPPKTPSHPFLESVCPFDHPGSYSNELLSFATCCEKRPRHFLIQNTVFASFISESQGTEISILPFFPPKSATVAAARAV